IRGSPEGQPFDVSIDVPRPTSRPQLVSGETALPYPIFGKRLPNAYRTAGALHQREPHDVVLVADRSKRLLAQPACVVKPGEITDAAATQQPPIVRLGRRVKYTCAVPGGINRIIRAVADCRPARRDRL